MDDYNSCQKIIIYQNLQMTSDYTVLYPHQQNEKSNHPTNYVSTTKYNLITFLPLSLILQFRRYANIYFLACAILQSIPLISPLSPLSAILPLIFVLSLSMIRQGYQDYKRYKSDKESNASIAHVFKNLQNNLSNVEWSVLRVGDIVKVYKEQVVPVDIVPLYCSDISGISYVETSSLDGEKNLKPKIALSETQLMFNKKKQSFLSTYNINLVCQSPNADINTFTGTINLSDSSPNQSSVQVKSALTHKNFMLRGTKLKNTEWVVGLTVYTGKNTKIMMNGCNATNKVSNIQRKVNKIILLIIFFELFCCACSTVYCYLTCLQTTAFESLLRNGIVNCSQISGISYGSYFILYSTYIPISLIVSLQFVKVFQGYAMSTDKQMHCPINNRSMQCHTVSINQELGQIQYILTDKTGTLTCNKMQFKNIIVGHNVYGDDIKLINNQKQFDFQKLARRYSRVMSFKEVQGSAKKDKGNEDSSLFDSRGISYELSMESDIVRPQTYQDSSSIQQIKKSTSNKSIKNQPSQHKKQIQLIFFMITTCHECLRQVPSEKQPILPQKPKKQQKSKKQQKKSNSQSSVPLPPVPTYHGPSPDQVALLMAAKKIGFQFISTQNKITTVLYNNVQHKFRILKIIQFDSDRKRMTVAVQRLSDGVKMVFVKGADSAIKKLLINGQKYLKFVQQKTKDMAITGLRSLWFAYKIMPMETDFDNIPTQQIQKDLNLIGATGIQDRLQDYVAETIYSLKQGGIKFIMLTGDKLQTAQNIARSCKMITEGFLISNKNQLQQGIKYIKDIKQSSRQNVAPVIDGSTLPFQTNEAQLLQILKISQSAVFCRVTPNQKAQIVRLVKKLGKLTLAIGDGANDVNMILQAHVGVGIFGQEGTRAAQVSNYAIGQFCLLWKLLLYYGRLNYMRVAEMILYFFYKNMVFTIVQFAYSFYNLGSGQSFWSSWSITFYNMVFTFFPVVLRAVFQVDVYVESNKKTLQQISEGLHENKVLYSYYPKMYLISQKNEMFTNLLFFQWFFLGVLQGVICLMISLYSMDALSNTSGYNSFQTGFYFAQLSAYTSVIIVVTIKLAVNVRNWNCILFIGFLVPSLGAYILFCALQNFIGFSDTQGYFTQIITMPSFYLAGVLAVLGMFAIDLFLFSISATRNNFQNYFKKRAMLGRRMTQTHLQELILKMEKKGSLLTNQN